MQGDAHWLPYALSAATINIMLGYFWFLRLTDSPQLTRPRGPVASPLKNLARFRRVYHGEEHMYVSNELIPEFEPEPNY